MTPRSFRHFLSLPLRHFATLPLLLLLLLSSPSLAQQAPEGNAHPATEAVTKDTEKLPNPFGAPVTDQITPTDRKLTLRDSVDLEPLRTLAVQHDGRVKILDTLARETVSRICGRKNYQDFIAQPGGGRGGGGAPKVISYDPIFTLLDVMIDPAYYVNKPLIHVEYLPLREAYLDAAFPAQPGETPQQVSAREAEKDRWMHLTRLSPMIAITYGQEMQDRYDTDLPYRTSLGQIATAIDLLQNAPANLLMIAPESHDQEYRHISTLPDTSPIRQAAAALGEGWRAGDAAKVNAAIRTLADELPKINAQNYPTTRRNVEYAYNRANAFEWGYWAYALSLLTLLLAFGTGRKPLIAAGIAFLSLAVGLHAFGFITRCIIAERFAIQNQFESMTGLSLFGCIVGLSIMVLKRQWLFGAAAAGVGFLVLITATQTQIPGRFIEREAAILNTSVLLKYHVTTVLCSYGLISLGFIVSLFYLGAYYGSKLRAVPPIAGSGAIGAPATASLTTQPLATPSLTRNSPRAIAAPVMATTALNLPDSAPRGIARTLADLDRAQMTVLQLAFWGLGVGILLGAWWADHSWGRWWAFDPKETWALVTWLIYLIVVHIRVGLTGPKRALVTAWLSVLGFFVMLWTYFGVNLLLPGLHAYA